MVIKTVVTLLRKIMNTWQTPGIESLESLGIRKILYRYSHPLFTKRMKGGDLALNADFECLSSWFTD